MISAIVLSAGLSSRMQQNKMLLPLSSGVPMIRQVVNQIQDAGFHEIIVVTGNMSKQIEEVLSGTSISAIHNPFFNSGMTSSIIAGLRHSHEDSTGFAVCLGDMPLITTDEYRTMIDAFKNVSKEKPNVIVAPRFEGRQGNPVIFSNAYRNEILTCANPEGCKEVVQGNKEHLVHVEMDTGHVLVDIDTPEALEEVRSRR